MYNLNKELNRISKEINSSEAKDIEQFNRFYKIAHEKWGNRVMEWVRFDTFEEFRDHIQALLYIAMFYSAFVTKKNEGLSENTGLITSPL